MSLVQYIQSKNVAIPQSFIEQFVYNYEHRNEWTRSDILYEQQFKD
jgi:small-conductance mechanosensitive channel